MSERSEYLADAALIEELITPEGVPVRIGVAPAGQRLTAFLVDTGIQIVLSLAVYLFAVWLAVGVAAALGMISAFLIRHFYFIWFEGRWRGATPGKRMMKIRVIDAHAGQLSVEAIIVRNLTREMETYLPLILLAFQGYFWPGGPGWLTLVASVWILLFLVFPLFNRQRRRMGDLIAGTKVVCTPRITLLDDLVATPVPEQDPSGTEFVFTGEQLDIYGTYELQVLERVLRQEGMPDQVETRKRVSETIQEKIGWDKPVRDDDAFLNAFYAALRRHLEQRLLFGKARERKFCARRPAAIAIRAQSLMWNARPAASDPTICSDCALAAPSF
ncbi:RDD family protein [Candidatus Eisenbacteria bacterium]|uniref:RDD family protein n=1 Tax=Eiseniibacteriota bacterium TaxID=2212470 RepID=A0ABV6YMB5_UNCEI